MLTIDYHTGSDSASAGLGRSAHLAVYYPSGGLGLVVLILVILLLLGERPFGLELGSGL